jgi:hypothetical protein
MMKIPKAVIPAGGKDQSSLLFPRLVDCDGWLRDGSAAHVQALCEWRQL